MDIFTFIIGLTALTVAAAAFFYVVVPKKEYSDGIGGVNIIAALADFFLAYFLTIAAGVLVSFAVPYALVYKLVPPFVSQWLVTSFHLGTVQGNHQILSLLAGLVLIPVSAVVLSLTLLAVGRVRNSVRSLRIAIVNGVKRAVVRK